MSLYLKYRPDDLSQVRGNADLLVSLERMLDDLKTCPHSFLLHGPTGCGKTTIARIIGKRLGCSELDTIEVDSADFRGIDTIREIRRNASFMASDGERRIWIIDECHKLTNDAQNALLKILEEPPSHVYFVLCTTEPQKLISTIRGRCITFQVNPLTDAHMFRLLRGISRKEGFTVKKEVLDQIVQDSMGLPRNAINILEQVLNTPEDRQIEVAKQTAEKQSQIIELCRILMAPKRSWNSVKVILEGLKTEEPETIRRVVLGYCSAVLLRSPNDMAAAIIEAFWEPTYNIGFPGVVFACYSIING